MWPGAEMLARLPQACKLHQFNTEVAEGKLFPRSVGKTRVCMHILTRDPPNFALTIKIIATRKPRQIPGLTKSTWTATSSTRQMAGNRAEKRSGPTHVN